MLCDSRGRPICAYCREPMRRSPESDVYTRAREHRLTFTCDDCGAVELFTVGSRSRDGPGQAA